MDQEGSNEYPQQLEVATLGGGCFWCTEAVFSKVRGVVNVESGYSGGTLAHPTYERVSTGNTGHAEVIQITFDVHIISFKEVLEIFFTIHDPTTLNRQGFDVGSQYRSIIFYHNEEQKAIAEQVINELQAAKIWNAPIVTQIEEFKEFYKAEEYHREYYKRYPERSYCRIIIEPKIVKLHKHFQKKLKKS